VLTEENKQPFDIEAFLATVDGGRTLSTYQRNQIVFSQGDAADSVFLHSKWQGQEDRPIRPGQGSYRRHLGGG
jgi:hypothetical protein